MFADRLRQILRLALPAARKPRRRPCWRPSLEGLESRLAPAAFVAQPRDAPATQSAPQTVYVNPAWANVPNGTDPDGSGPATAMGFDAFADPQSGVNAVAPGGTVNLAAATFQWGNLQLNKAVHLKGSGSATTTLMGVAGFGLTITGPGDDVSGLTLEHYTWPLYASGGSYLALTDVRLTGNTVGGGIVNVDSVLIAGSAADETFFVQPGSLARQGDNPISYTGVRTLTVDGGGGNNSLVVFLNDISTPDTVWVNANAIARGQRPSFVLWYRATGGSFGGGVTAVLGDGPETVVVQGQLPGAPTTVYAEGGDDTFFVAVTAASNYSLLTLDGGGGNDSLAVFDQTGGASLTNVVAVIGEGQIQVMFPGGSSSTISYQNVEQILGGLPTQMA